MAEECPVDFSARKERTVACTPMNETTQLAWMVRGMEIVDAEAEEEIEGDRLSRRARNWW